MPRCICRKDSHRNHFNGRGFRLFGIHVYPGGYVGEEILVSLYGFTMFFNAGIIPWYLTMRSLAL